MNHAQQEKYISLSNMLAIISLVTWIMPIIGIPISIAGIVYALKVKGSDARAIISIILCILTLIVSSFNAYIGAKDIYNRAFQTQTSIN